MLGAIVAAEPNASRLLRQVLTGQGALEGQVWTVGPGSAPAWAAPASGGFTSYAETVAYPYQTAAGQHLEARGAGGSVLLPNSAGLVVGASVEVSNASAGAVTVSGDVSINGEANYPLAVEEVATFYWDGAQWGIR